jgi:hypothetical protein
VYRLVEEASLLSLISPRVVFGFEGRSPSARWNCFLDASVTVSSTMTAKHCDVERTQVPHRQGQWRMTTMTKTRRARPPRLSHHRCRAPWSERYVQGCAATAGLRSLSRAFLPSHTNCTTRLLLARTGTTPRRRLPRPVLLSRGSSSTFSVRVYYL